MAKLDKDSTFEDMENFLIFHMDEADGRRSILNPSLTKEQVWNISMGSVMKKSIRVKNIVVKHIVKEFGSYYKEEANE